MFQVIDVIESIEEFRSSNFRRNISNNLLEQIDLMIEKQQKVFSCKVCRYKSSNKGHVNEHVEKHIEGLEYPCNICTKVLRYFQLDYLSILMKSGRPPLLVLEMMVSLRLINFMRAPKNYFSSFRNSSALRSHKKIHK